MARLNTTAPPKLGEPRLRPNSSLQTGPAPSRTEPRISRLTAERAKQWSMGSETGTTSSKSPIQRSRSQRNGKGSGGCFDIFHDVDETGEREDDGGLASKRSSGSEGGGKAMSKSPLKLAKVNSLLLQAPQQGRTQPTRKSELDYDKENDVGEREMDELASTERGQRQSSTSRDRSVGQTPGRIGNNRQFQGFREPGTQDGDASDTAENAFDSMDDFIVSDNEELSYYEASEAETDDAAPPPPPPTRRRLFRGRRPDPEAEIRQELESPSQIEALRLEPSLCSKLAIPPLGSDSLPKEVSQDELNVDEKMTRLSLDNNHASSQLEKDVQL